MSDDLTASTSTVWRITIDVVDTLNGGSRVNTSGLTRDWVRGLMAHLSAEVEGYEAKADTKSPESEEAQSRACKLGVKAVALDPHTMTPIDSPSGPKQVQIR